MLVFPTVFNRQRADENIWLLVFVNPRLWACFDAVAFLISLIDSRHLGADVLAVGGPYFFASNQSKKRDIKKS